MWNSASPNKVDSLESFYSKAIGKHLHANGSPISGGSKNPPKVGGYTDLEKYGNSVFSESKEKLIRGIAKDVASMLKTTTSFAESADINEVIDKLKKIVPDPKNKKILSSKKEVHEELCAKLAKSINKQYGMEVVDENSSTEVICKRVGEVIYSLFTGLHTEFLTISGEVARILKNLQILQELVDSANKKLIDKLPSAEAEEAASIRHLYDALTEEIKRQQVILSNITSSVIGPTGESIISILEINDDFAGLTTDIKKILGTKEFGHKLGLVLNGTGDLAYTAGIIDKALKEIGMSVAEYKATQGIKELTEKVYDTIIKRRPGSEELEKMLNAASVLYKNDLMHENIVEYLDKKKGGAVTTYGNSYADAAEIATSGSYDENNPFRGRLQSDKKSIRKQLDEKTLLRKELFGALNNKFKDSYTKIKYSLAKIGKKLGSSIEASPELELFIKQLENFANSQPDRHNIHIALSGYRKDIESEYIKFRFMENLHTISETAVPLITGAQADLFRDVKTHVDGLINLIVEFNATFLKTLTDIRVTPLGIKVSKTGGGCFDSDDVSETPELPETDEAPQNRDELVTGAGDFDDTAFGVLGGGDFDKTAFSVLGGIIGLFSDKEFNHFQTMKRTIRELDYYYRIAGIKRNLVKTSHEYESNVQNYENILGEEAGYLIDQIQTKYNGLMTALDGTTSTTPIDYGKLYADDCAIGPSIKLNTPLHESIKDYKAVAGRTDVEKTAMDSYEGGYKFLLEYIRSSKVEMLEAAQSLDLYLSKFTREVQFKPDQIKEFVQILEQLEVVAKWFTDKSGDKLAAVFETFAKTGDVDVTVGPIPDLVVNTTVNNDLSSPSFPLTNDHYYEYLQSQNYETGKFYRPRMMTREQAINFVKQIESAIKSVRALENVISAFSKINIDASEEIKTFMTSGLMFKTFMKYSVASVISVGYLHKSDTERGLHGGFLLNAATPVEVIHAKMAVSLKFAKNTIPVAANSFLELCDPLSINSKSKQYDICDEIFGMCIKSLISKVFVVVGSYALFNKPPYGDDKKHSMSLATNPLRQIMGGSQSISVIDDAAELYLRLPLVAEWYRDVFEFNDSTPAQIADRRALGPNQGNPLISVIPDMDSIWGDLCKVIFVDAVNITDGSYPTEYSNRIIKSINDIYMSFKSKHPTITCKEIISEFILDINRRYGFIMRQEIDAYIAEKRAYKDIDSEYPDEENVEYDILDVEMQIGRLPAPSDKFRTYNKKKTDRKFDLQDLLKVVGRFRRSIENNLQLPAGQNGQVADADADFRSSANVSLNGIINETVVNMKYAKSVDEKYNIVHRQLHGVDKFGDLDVQKLILFHETVVTPLTVLYFTYSILNRFNRFFTSMNPEGVNPITAAGLLQKAQTNFKGTNNPFSNVASVLIGNADYNTYIQAQANAFTSVTIKDVLNKLMNIGCDLNGLTEVSWVGSTKENTHPVVVYDKLQEVCTVLFNDAKQAFHNLRKFLPSTLIQKYEARAIINIDNNINIFYLQENLFNRLFGNKYGNGLVDANIAIKNLWIHLISIPQADYNNDISQIGFWDTTTQQNPLPYIPWNNDMLSFPYEFQPIFNSGGSILNTKNKDELKEINFIKTNGGQGVLAANYPAGLTAQLKVVARGLTPAYQRIYATDISTVYNINLYLGLVQKLNNLIYRYCNIFIDKSNNKIYKKLIEKFVTGYNAKEIIDNKWIDDYQNNVLARDPPARAVLFRSIAEGLNTLFTTQADKTFGTLSLFTEDNIQKVSEYQRELMKANLPGFAKELELLSHKSIFMKNCLEETNVNTTDPARKLYLISIYDDINATSKSLLRCITDTQQDLGDIPMYFETYSDSIVDYNNQNGHLPFMPLSNITYLMNFRSFLTTLIAPNNMYKLSIIPQPSVGLGSNEYKFIYGTRGLLNKQEASLEFAPGMVDILNRYNNKVDVSATFDKNLFSNVYKNTVFLSRFIIDTIYHKKLLENCNWNESRDILEDNIKNLSCQTGRSHDINGTKRIEEITNSLDHNDYRQSTNSLVECISGGNDANSISGFGRKNFRVYNILDLNIVPINVHSLQKEVPFVNIYNYSYTFDHIIKNFVANTNNQITDAVEPQNPQRDPKLTLTKYITYPLGDRSMNEYVNNSFRIMTGTVSEPHGRPKYLSDQLWNKVLLNSIYPNQAALDNPMPFKNGGIGLIIAIGQELLDRGGINGVRQNLSQALTYLKDKAVTTPNPAPQYLAQLSTEGYLRYNSKLVRYTEWFIQLQRIVRLLMRKQLEWVQDPVVQGNEAISEEVTEYKGVNTFNLADYE